jgi:hypothetical protein
MFRMFVLLTILIGVVYFLTSTESFSVKITHVSTSETSFVKRSDVPLHQLSKTETADLKVRYKHIIKVFRDIEAVAGIPRDVKLQITIGGDAMTNTWNIISLPTWMIDEFFSRDIDYAALVIGHEFAHIKKGHTSWVPPWLSRIQEKDADLLGMEFANKAGYNGCDGPKMWKDFLRLYGANPEDVDHDHPSERARYMACGGK